MQRKVRIYVGVQRSYSLHALNYYNTYKNYIEHDLHLSSVIFCTKIKNQLIRYTCIKLILAGDIKNILLPVQMVFIGYFCILYNTVSFEFSFHSFPVCST